MVFGINVEHLERVWSSPFHDVTWYLSSTFSCLFMFPKFQPASLHFLRPHQFVLIPTHYYFPIVGPLSRSSYSTWHINYHCLLEINELLQLWKLRTQADNKLIWMPGFLRALFLSYARLSEPIFLKVKLSTFEPSLLQRQFISAWETDN